MAKRSLDEYEDVSEVVQPSPKAKIRCVVTSLSPIRPSKTCSFFEGEVTDGKGKMRVFGFDSRVRRRLVDFQATKETVAMRNCEVKHGRKTEGLEILVTKQTKFEKCEKVFDVGSTCGKPEVTALNELSKLVVFQRVTVEAKILRLEEVMEVAGGKKKQDVVIGDRHGIARLTGTPSSGRFCKAA